MKLTQFLKHIADDAQGATAVEYGLIVSLVVIAMVGALQSVANTTSNMWNDVESDVVEASEGAD